MNIAVWGSNSYGQLGMGTRSEQEAEVVFLSPSRVSSLPELSNIRSICGGGGHTLFLTHGGEVYGCGWGASGQLLSTEAVHLDFVKLPNLEGYKIAQIGTLWDTCLAVTEDGLCIGWGSNSHSQLGQPNTEIRNVITPLVIARNVKEAACGGRHCVLLLKDGTVLTAGSEALGRLGRTTAFDNTEFQPVPGLRGIKRISCGFNHSIVESEDGKIYGWGSNKAGQLGHDPKDYSFFSEPQQIFGISQNLESIQCGWSSTHFLTVGGTLQNFGRNSYGQLGQFDSPDVQPWEVHCMDGIKKLSVGSEHSVAVKSDGELVSWGWNEHGSCGNGNTENQFIPTNVNIGGFYKVELLSAASGFNYTLLTKME